MVEAANARLEITDGAAAAAVEKSLKDAFAAAKSIEGRRSEVGQVLIEIGSAQAAVKDVAGTRETFDFARTSLLAADFKERDNTLAALAAAQVLSGDRIQAMNIVHAMENEALRSMALHPSLGHWQSFPILIPHDLCFVSPLKMRLRQSTKRSATKSYSIFS